MAIKNANKQYGITYNGEEVGFFYLSDYCGIKEIIGELEDKKFAIKYGKKDYQ